MAEPEASTTTRRRVLAAGFAVAAAAAGGPAFATSLAATPRQTPGPFYPRTLPLDSDNDLVAVAGRGGTAAGTVSHVMGHVLDASGNPLGGMTVEIWQCDARGIYHHPRDPGRAGADTNFQGYGRTVTEPAGGYRFRTIEPVPYPGRTPHIHFAVSGHGVSGFTTQMYIAGHPLNERDFVLRAIPEGAARQSLLVAFRPGDEIEPGAKLANFDIVLASGTQT